MGLRPWSVFVAAVWLVTPAASDGGRKPWETHKSKHFIVMHSDADELARKVCVAAEKHYVRIARDLGYTRYDNFWLWDERAVIRIHASHAAYVAATRAPAWSAGKANHTKREVETFVGSPAFVERILPHELTHLVFRDFVGFRGEVPLWLDEGVAQWQETRATGDGVHRLAGRLHRSGGLLPVSQLTRVDVRKGAGAVHAALFYAQAASLVSFMISEYGAPSFQKLCTQLRDGKSLNDALRFTYPRTIRSMQALDKAWKQHLESIK